MLSQAVGLGSRAALTDEATAALQLVHPTTVSGGADLLQHVLGVGVQAVLPSLLASVSAALRPELLTLLHGIELRG